MYMCYLLRYLFKKAAECICVIYLDIILFTVVSIIRAKPLEPSDNVRSRVISKKAPMTKNKQVLHFHLQTFILYNTVYLFITLFHCSFVFS